MSAEQTPPERQPLAPPLVGHHEVRRALSAAVTSGRLPHALLIAGEAGIGKAALALWLVQRRWCAADEPPCLTCPTCRKVSTGNHPDVTLLRREPDEGVLTVDRVREEVVEALALASTEGRGRVVILDGADDLNEEAQNALLKTLEEPPRDSLLVLVTAREERLLDTIRSRCQEVRAHPLAAEEMADLQAGDPLLARLCRGRPGRLAAWADVDVAGLVALLDEWLAGQAPGSALAARLAEQAGDRPERVLEVLAARLRDLALLESGLEETALLLPAPAPGVQLPPFWALERMQEAVYEAVEDLRRNLPASVAWTALGLEFATARMGGRSAGDPQG